MISGHAFPLLMLTRTSLRQHLRQQRTALTKALVQKAAQQLTIHLSQQRVFQTSQRIAFYLAQSNELDVSGLLTLASAQQQQCYLPILHPTQARQLWFQAYTPGEALISNRYGILEPKLNPAKLLAAEQLDLVLVPLLAFDAQGNRLGMGGGYYDTTFAFLNQAPRPTCPYLLGIAYQWQQVEQLPAENWDIRLNGVSTETHFYEFSFLSPLPKE